MAYPKHQRVSIPMVSYFIFLISITCAGNQIMAQDTATSTLKNPNKKYSLGFLYENGYVFQTNLFLRGVNAEKEAIKSYQGFSGRIIFQTTGKKLWQRLYNFPYWGVGVHVSTFDNPEEMGVPIAAYAFINGPFHRWGKFSLNYEIDFGLTVNWKRFNPVSNQYNIAIGAGETVYIHTGITFAYRLTKQFEASFGLGLAHFSNGALKLPNFGLNTFSPRVGIRYNIHGLSKYNNQKIPKFKKHNTLEIILFTGLKNVLYDSLQVSIRQKYKGVYFPLYGFRATLSRQLTYKSKIGIGLSVSYDGSVNARVAVEQGKLDVADSPFAEKLRLSIYPSYGLVMGRYSLILQPGFYLYRKQFTHQVPVSYQRIGLNYHFGKHFVGGISLRAYNFHVSDFIEWSLGYRVNWEKD